MIVITGANGFIGSALVWEFNRLGRSDLVCVDSVGLQQRPQLLAGRKYASLLHKDQIWDFLGQNGPGSIEAIVHMGACSTTTEMNEEFLRENNTLYTQRIWQWCVRENVPYVFASSGAVYGDGANGFDDSMDPDKLQPLNPYGFSKVAFDRWAVRQSTTPRHWWGLRFFNVFGPNENFKGDMSSVVFKAFAQIRDTGKLRLFRSHNPKYRDGEQMRDFVYVKDITRWILELLQKKPQSGIYNMGFGKARTWLDLAGATFAAMGKPMQIDWIDIPVEMRPRYQYFTEARIDRLLNLGLSRPEWPLETAVSDYVKLYLTAGKLL